MEKRLFSKELEEFLKAWGILEVATARTKDCFTVEQIDRIPECSLTLWDAFTWRLTPEGSEVWGGIEEMFSYFVEDTQATCNTIVPINLN